MIIDLLFNKNRKSVSKKYDKLIEKHKANEPLNKRLTQKKEIKNKAASKIIKLYRNSLKFEIVDRQEAFKNKVKQITVKPSFIGSSMATDLDAFVARSYVIARREIPKNEEFKLYASLTGTGYGYSIGEFKINITTSTFNSKELNKFLDDFIDRINSMIQSDAKIDLSTVKFIYNFAIIPSGGGVGTKCREIEAILETKSVVEIVNDDNNCFGIVWQSYLTLTIDH